MIFKKIIYVILLFWITALIILNLRLEMDGSPWLQMIASYLIASLALSLLIYLLFKKTRADTYAISFLQLLFLGYLIIFLICIGNVLLMLVNTFPLFFGYEPWVGKIFPGPYMWLAGMAFIPSLFSLLLSVYWSEVKMEKNREEGMVDDTVGY